MRWHRDLTDSPQYMVIVGVTWLVLTCLTIAALVRLWGTGGALLAGGASIAVMVLWDTLVERPKRVARRKSGRLQQSAPGTQPLQSPEGSHEPHWAERLPYPLSSLGPFVPVTAVAAGIVFITLLLNALIGGCSTP